MRPTPSCSSDGPLKVSVAPGAHYHAPPPPVRGYRPEHMQMSRLLGMLALVANRGLPRMSALDLHNGPALDRVDCNRIGGCRQHHPHRYNPLTSLLTNDSAGYHSGDGACSPIPSLSLSLLINSSIWVCFWNLLNMITNQSIDQSNTREPKACDS